MSTHPFPVRPGRTSLCRTEGGLFLRLLRKGLGLSQMRVAKISGVRQVFLSKLELGLRALHEGQIKGLARALRCHPKHLRQFLPPPRELMPRTKIGQLILTRMEKLELRITDFADRMGFSKKRAEAFIMKKRPGLSYDSAHRLANALEVPFRELGPYVGTMQTEVLTGLGLSIRAHRLALGLSQTQLARLIPCSRQLLSAMEHGIHPITSQNPTLERLAELFSTTTDALLSGKKPSRRRKAKHLRRPSRKRRR